MSTGEGEPDIDLTADMSALEEARNRRLALGDAADLVEDLIARPGSDPRWTVRVADSMQGLRYAFDAHVDEVEDDDGLLPRLQADAPRLTNLIRRMYDEHDTIATEMDAAAGLIRECEGECDADAVDEIRVAVVEVLKSISRHRQRGADLVYEAYHVDIGGPG